MNVKELQKPGWLVDKFRQGGRELVALYLVNGFLQVMVGSEPPNGELHLSVSHPNRYPTWDEIRDLRYALLPGDKTYAILFPPKDQYINVHPNCFHLYEVPAMHETQPLTR